MVLPVALFSINQSACFILRVFSQLGEGHGGVLTLRPPHLILNPASFQLLNIPVLLPRLTP